MGTRHLVCVVKDKKFKVAQYGQYDGYLSGAGEGVFKFLLEEYDRAAFAMQVDRVRGLTEEDVKSIHSSTSAVSWEKSYAHLNRGFSSDILSFVQQTEKACKAHEDCLQSLALGLKCSNPPVPEVMLGTEFAGDGLMCEWAYVLDLDTETLEIFRGFNTTPLKKTERFYFLQKGSPKSFKPKYDEQNWYSPVKLWQKMAFKSITKDTLDKLAAILSQEEEAEEERRAANANWEKASEG